MFFNIEDIRVLCTNQTITVTKHAVEQIRKRGIRFIDIKSAISNGEIIEEYPYESPNPRVLILGYADEKRPLHVVVGIGDWNLQIITAYYPTLNKWENDYKTRRS
jgi:uncharacterized DUF497 family protein